MNAFLSSHEKFRVLTKNDLKLSIICADDYYCNIEALRLVFRKLDLEAFCLFFDNGHSVIDYCKKNVQNQLQQQRGERKEVTIMILDHEMPRVSGLETIKEVRSLYNVSNFMIQSQQRIEGVATDEKLLMPKFAMFSAHVKKGF